MIAPIAVLRVRRRPGDPTRGVLVAGPLAVPCALGRSGVRVGKREGDGATPFGLIRLVRAFYRPDRGPPPWTGLPLERLRPKDGWCDDPAARRYNRRVARPCRASHEAMWRDDALYDVVIETDWNRSPAIPGRGSAIFMHIARDGFRPTEGCVAVSAAAMRRLLPRLGPGTVLDIG